MIQQQLHDPPANLSESIESLLEKKASEYLRKQEESLLKQCEEAKNQQLVSFLKERSNSIPKASRSQEDINPRPSNFFRPTKSETATDSGHSAFGRE